MESIMTTLLVFPLIIILVTQGVSSAEIICNNSSSSSCRPGEICSDGLCTCPGTPLIKQIYDDFEQKCVFLVGENCTTTEECISSSTCHPEWNTELNRFQGKCRCASGNFFENVTTGTCQERAEFGQICNEDLPCRISHLLSCHPSQGICQCLNDQTQTYDPFKNSCVLKLGENCYDHRRHIKTICPQNAECVYFFSKKQIPRCKCMKGFIQSSEGTCRGGFGSECNSTNPCYEAGNLVCSDGLCQCDSPLTQTFNEKQKICLKVVGSVCDLTLSDCIPHTICQDGICTCKSGYSKTSQRTCQLDNGEKCGWGHGPRCNTDAGLACREGICKCFDSRNLIYDSETKVCRLPSEGMNTNANTGFTSMKECGLREDIVSKRKYPVRCPKGYECNRESQDLGCSCGTRNNPQFRRDDFCLRSNL